jgi:UDP:flavonoid glycosyltransferase YjiC (YdhE family)
VVYIGFGSIVVSDPKAMTRIIIEAIVHSGIYAILSKGWSDRLQTKTSGEVTEPEEPLPKQIFQITSVPHDWLFQRIDAACHHGGAGTTGASLRGISQDLRMMRCVLIQYGSGHTYCYQTIFWRSILLG